MKPRLAILFCLALVLVAFFCVIFQSRGQAFTPRRPFVYALASSAPLLPGTENHWIFTSLPTNNVLVNCWTDVLAGITATNNGILGASPTNTQYGIYFKSGSSDQLNLGSTNTSSLVTTPNATVAIIYRPDVQLQFNAMYESQYWRIRRVATTKWYAGYSSEIAFFTDTDRLGIDADIVIVRTNQSTITLYTNGVASLYTNEATAELVVPYTFGGLRSSSTRGMGGWLKEIWYATNSCWDSVSISNFHYYSTNTYHYAP